MDLYLVLKKQKKMAGKLRKIAVGPDYKSAMKFTVGSEFSYNGEVQGVVHHIGVEGRGFDKKVKVYLQNYRNEVFVWKWWNYNTAAIHFEDDISFQ